MTKKKVYFTDWSNIIWAVSDISKMIGSISTSAEEGRMLTWSNKKTGEYWLYLIACDSGKPHFLIYEDRAPTKKMYAVMGYCDYHEYEVEISAYESKEKEAQQ